MHETTGYYKNTLEYFIYATSINEDFDDFELKMNEFQVGWAYEDSGFRIYKVNDTYARCLSKRFLTDITLITKSNKAKVNKIFVTSNLYSFTADLDLFSYSYSLRFTAEKTSFMNSNDIYSFRINKETSSNYFILYDYKEKKISNILGYYDEANDYIIFLYKTPNSIKYFTLRNNGGIFNINFYNKIIKMKTYEHIEIDTNEFIEENSNFGHLNVESITRNISGVVTTEYFGTDFNELIMEDNIFIPEKSFKTWYRYNFFFIEHINNDYTRIYYLNNVNIIIKTCYSFECKSCWENYNECDDCQMGKSFALLSDDNSKCYPTNQLVKGYIYIEINNLFEKCYSSCEFCFSSSVNSSAHNCISCAEGFLFSYKYKGNCYKLNDLQINEEKIVNNINNEKFSSSSCSLNKINSTGECIDECPRTDIYYSFNYNSETSSYNKIIINSPKYLFNKICYDKCPLNLIPDEVIRVCKCEHTFHIENEEIICDISQNCISDYPYKNLDTNQCYSSLNNCNYFFNNDCYNECPNGKVVLSSKTDIIINYFITELLLDSNLKNKLCICDIVNGVWSNLNSKGYQECLEICPEGYEPESITNHCILKKEPPTTNIKTTNIVTSTTELAVSTTQPFSTIFSNIITGPSTTEIKVDTTEQFIKEFTDRIKEFSTISTTERFKTEMTNIKVESSKTESANQKSTEIKKIMTIEPVLNKFTEIRSKLSDPDIKTISTGSSSTEFKDFNEEEKTDELILIKIKSNF